MSTEHIDTVCREHIPNAVNAVAVKLPDLWETNCVAWFARAEAQFRTRAITAEATKFDYVLGALTSDTVSGVIDIVKNPPAGTEYTALKNAIISRYELSDRRKLEQILSKDDIGDKKPSEFYRQMETNAGNSQLYTKDLLKEIWLSRLPKDISTILAGLDCLDIQSLVARADKIWELSCPSISSVGANLKPKSIQATSGSSNKLPYASNFEIDSLKNEISEIKNILKSLNASSHGRSPSRSSQKWRGRSHSRGRSQSNRNRDFCWYHNRFGERATTCTQPCKYQSDVSTQKN